MTTAARWWRYAVLRGEGIPAYLDGMWLDLDESPERFADLSATYGRSFDATNCWEQRSDGQVAVVYRWARR